MINDARSVPTEISSSTIIQEDGDQVIAKVEEKSKSDIVEFLASETQKSEGKLDKLAINNKQKKTQLFIDAGFFYALDFAFLVLVLVFL